jgi:penicillin-binding protein 1A
MAHLQRCAEQAAKAAEGTEALEAQANDSHAESEGQDGDNARDGGAGEEEGTQDAGHQTKDEANGDDAGQGEGQGQGEGEGGTSEFATPSAGSPVDGAEGTNGGGDQGAEHRPAEVRCTWGWVTRTMPS